MGEIKFIYVCIWDKENIVIYCCYRNFVVYIINEILYSFLILSFWFIIASYIFDS